MLNFGGGKQDKYGLVKMVNSGPLRASRARERHENNSFYNQMKPQCNSSLQLEFVSLFWTGLLEGEKKKNKAESFSTLFLISTLTWITEKELERAKFR